MTDFPPLLSVAHVEGDPFALALAAARAESAPARLHTAATDKTLAMALELAPEMPLSTAMVAMPALALGVADAIGALAPPEVGVFVRWPATLLLNGAEWGALNAAASHSAPDEEPDWLIVAATLRLASDGEPGHAPNTTSLSEEGAALSAETLAPAIARHTLSWLYTLEHEGPAPVLAAFGAKLWREDATVGLDEAGGRITRTDGATTITPLTAHLA
ncbi:MAG: biotin/lipoate--protein ligase family protein [Pseudomonadota bacterium]